MTTFVLSMFNSNLVDAKGMPVVLGLALAYGGIVQLLAGMWEFRTGNTFGAVAFCSFGAFWISFWALNVFYAKDIGGNAGHAIGVYLWAWAIFTAYMTVAALRVSGAVLLVFVLLTLTFVLLAIGAVGRARNGHRTGAATSVSRLPPPRGTRRSPPSPTRRSGEPCCRSSHSAGAERRGAAAQQRRAASPVEEWSAGKPMTSRQRSGCDGDWIRRTRCGGGARRGARIAARCRALRPAAGRSASTRCSTIPPIYEQAASDPQAWWAEQARAARLVSEVDPRARRRRPAVLQVVHRRHAERLLQLPRPPRDRRPRRARRLPLARRGRHGARHHLRGAARRGRTLRQRAQGPRRARRRRRRDLPADDPRGRRRDARLRAHRRAAQRRLRRLLRRGRARAHGVLRRRRC